jgi:hypothetical protein
MDSAGVNGPKANLSGEMPSPNILTAKDVEPSPPEPERAEKREGDHIVYSGRWVELLRRPNVLAGRAMGDWREDKTGLIASGLRDDMILSLPVTVSGNYELVVEYVRVNGTGSVHVFLPVGTRGCVLVIDGWGVAASGLQTIDGKGTRDNPTRTRYSIKTGTRRKAAVKVRVKGEMAVIESILDDAVRISWEGKVASLGTHSPKPSQIGLGGYGSTIVFSSARLRLMATGKGSWIR